ncbi:MAG: hypothetical protein DHS20C20_26440 [Ardenticatenaceae bacterium]|nr:MAG: hypothetical protein DHS20C20_26440 [Ardenticatenaceae bacterium]
MIVMDLLLPGGIDGLEVTRQARAQRPEVQVVALIAYTDDARVVAALRAGRLVTWARTPIREFCSRPCAPLPKGSPSLARPPPAP